MWRDVALKADVGGEKGDHTVKDSDSRDCRAASISKMCSTGAGMVSVARTE